MAALSTEPTRLNYQFGGWFPNADGSGTEFTATTVVNSNRTVYAKWISDANAVTITFNLNGGDGTAPSPITVESGENVTPPADPTRNGYTFSGWFTAATGGSAFVFTAVTTSATAYAQWIEANAITVTFDENGGDTEANPKVIAVTNGTIATLPTPPTYEGFFFGGWNTQADGDGDPFTTTTTVTQSITVYAVWSAEEVPVDFTVTFTKNSYAPGTADVEKKVTTMGGFVTDIPNDFALNAPWNAGVTFASWNTAADGTGSAFTATTAVNQDITVYAQWTFTEGTIEVDSENDALVHNAPPMENNRTEGSMQGSWWNGDDVNQGNTVNSDGSVTFSTGNSGGNPATQPNQPNQYAGGTVRYMYPQDGFPAGVSLEDYDFVTVHYAYTLDGSFPANSTTALSTIWKKGKSNADFNPMDNSGFYSSLSPAVAGAATPTFSIKLSGYSGINGVDDATGYESGLAIQRSNGGGTVKFVKAVFTKGTRHTITLDVGYPEGETLAPITAVEGVAITDLPTPAAREGYVFAGWFDDTESPAVAYNNATAMPTTDLALTAHWNVFKVVAPITVDFDAVTFRLSGATSATPLPDGTGYTYVDANYGQTALFKITLGTGVSLADYDKISFTITAVSGDLHDKSLYPIGGASGTPTTGGNGVDYNVSTYSGSPQNLGNSFVDDAVLDFVFTIDKTKSHVIGATGEIELGFYIHNAASSFIITDYKIYQE